MRVNLCWFALLLWAAPAHAEEQTASDAESLEVIEMLGEMDEDVADLDIAMSEIKISTNEKSIPLEVKNAE
jgi:hypothetical protein